MKKTLLAATAAVGLFALSAPANAGGWGWFDDNDPFLNAAVAVGVQVGVVLGAVNYEGYNHWWNIVDYDAFRNAEGAFNVGQNTGANSNVQNQQTIAALIGCECDDSLVNLAVSVGVQVGLVAGVYNNNYGSAYYNIISGNAFEYAKGAFNVGQNTGANSNVQNQQTISAIIR